MTEQQATKPNTNRRSILFFVVSCYLLATLLYRVTVPAHEYPLRPEQVLSIVLDAGCVIGLFGIRDAGPKGLWWAALIAGIGLFAIRLLGGDAAWWTGHLTYSLR